MPYLCPVCTKAYYPSQNCLECNICNNWVHHGNRLHCSGLTDAEFDQHKLNSDLPFECDHCVSKRIAKANNDIFIKLPFPVECEGNVFGKPEPKPKPDITSMSQEQLKKFVKQCKEIDSQL